MITTDRPTDHFVVPQRPRPFPTHRCVPPPVAPPPPRRRGQAGCPGGGRAGPARRPAPHRTPTSGMGGGTPAATPAGGRGTPGGGVRPTPDPPPWNFDPHRRIRVHQPSSHTGIGSGSNSPVGIHLPHQPFPSRHPHTLVTLRSRIFCVKTRNPDPTSSIAFIYISPPFEASDVIGTGAVRAAAAGQARGAVPDQPPPRTGRPPGQEGPHRPGPISPGAVVNRSNPFSN